jgi:hypothetical protein
VLTWDITRLRGPGKGEWFHPYVITRHLQPLHLRLDRPAGRIRRRVEELIRETIERNGISSGTARPARRAE